MCVSFLKSLKCTTHFTVLNTFFDNFILSSENLLKKNENYTYLKYLLLLISLINKRTAKHVKLLLLQHLVITDKTNKKKKQHIIVKISVFLAPLRI